MLEKAKDLYTENIQIQISASSLLPEQIVNATQMLIQCLLQGNKVIACGVGRSYANAQILVANLLNRYELARPSFPSVLLGLENSVGSVLYFEQNSENLYLNQFNSLACKQDLLIAFAPLGTEKTVLKTISYAVNKELNVIVLTGADNDSIQGLLGSSDLEISIPSHKESRIIENHLFIINTICELVDHSLFPAIVE